MSGGAGGIFSDPPRTYGALGYSLTRWSLTNLDSGLSAMFVRAEMIADTSLDVQGDGPLTVTVSTPYPLTFEVTVNRTGKKPEAPNVVVTGDIPCDGAIEAALRNTLDRGFNLKDPDEDRAYMFLWGLKQAIIARAYSVMRTLRWRVGGQTKSPKIGMWKIKYYFDGKEGRFPPPDPVGIPKISLRRDLPAESIAKEVTDMLAAGKVSGVSHELLDEAWLLYATSPRSAYAIGMTAFETAVEDYAVAAKKKPKGSTALFRLGHLCQLTKAHCYPPKATRDQLEHGRKTRNAIIHEGLDALPSSDLAQFLYAVGATLGLLDWCKGNAWAWQHINGMLPSEYKAERIVHEAHPEGWLPDDLIPKNN